MHVMTSTATRAIRANCLVLLEGSVHYGVRADSRDTATMAGVTKILHAAEDALSRACPQLLATGIMRNVTAETQVASRSGMTLHIMW
jgi:hypothetical protein